MGSFVKTLNISNICFFLLPLTVINRALVTLLILLLFCSEKEKLKNISLIIYQCTRVTLQSLIKLNNNWSLKLKFRVTFSFTLCTYFIDLLGIQMFFFLFDFIVCCFWFSFSQLTLLTFFSFSFPYLPIQVHIYNYLLLNNNNNKYLCIYILLLFNMT